MLFRDRLIVSLQAFDIALNGFLDIRYSFLFALTLADTARQRWHFDNPITILTGIHDDLSHSSILFVSDQDLTLRLLTHRLLFPGAALPVGWLLILRTGS